ncbi:MAG: hypothetical protein ACYTBJ_17725 [Planctomycetota bacterium]
MSMLKHRVGNEYFIIANVEERSFILEATDCGKNPFCTADVHGNTRWFCIDSWGQRFGEVPSDKNTIVFSAVTIGPPRKAREIKSFVFNGTEYPVKGDMFL